MNISEKAAKLHKESIVIDCLNISNWNDPEVFAGIHRGGVTATNATIACWENFEETIDTIAQWYLKFDKYADIIMPIRTVADIRKAKAEGKSGIIFGFQNSSPVEDDLRRLRVLHDLGVRIIQITYNNMNFVGAGHSESPDYGLSRFGRDFILECNRLGILVDLSHVGDRTVMDAIEVSEKPMAFTHVGPRALFHHYRNKTDEQLKAVVAKGGMVGANGISNFMAAGKDATLSDYLEIIDYMANLIGVDRLGIGPDFTTGQSTEWVQWLISGRNTDAKIEYPPATRLDDDGILRTGYPKNFQTAADFPNLTETLLDRGYSEADVKKIMGENLLRLFQEVWGE
ncbi:dipeptidase [Chloroflexota bacterium]